MIYLKVRHTQTHFPKLQDTEVGKHKTKQNKTPSKGKNEQEVTHNRARILGVPATQDMLEENKKMRKYGLSHIIKSLRKSDSEPTVLYSAKIAFK